MRTFAISCAYAVLLLAVVSGKPQGPPPLPYQYQYQVQDPGALGGPLDFGHQEARDTQTTNGQYQVLLPDGRIQTVRYQVTPTTNGQDGGYVAEVTYSK